MKTLFDKVWKQAAVELPQIEDQEERDNQVREYIDGMTNYELVDLLSRAMEIQS